MGRELQKKKNRSSLQKVRQNPKSKKVNPRSNPVIAANWDKSKTLAQNYRRLGLTHRLNASTGGTETAGSAPHDPLAIAALPKTLTPTTARVERDTDGNITRIIHSGKSRANPLNDPLNELSESEGEEDKPPQRSSARTGVIEELEWHAQQEAPKPVRKPSSREDEWVQMLVDKYGDDYKGMFWDRRLNPMQQTEGDIKRRVKRWRVTTGQT
ncbi:MAG: Nucleolar protein 16 [Piccolia ochrophora]|nr:MAG: Nucleolar protein 16 [Piccolia ochrophora]